MRKVVDLSSGESSHFCMLERTWTSALAKEKAPRDGTLQFNAIGMEVPFRTFHRYLLALEITARYYHCL